jgi:hypothetical protein
MKPDFPAHRAHAGLWEGTYRNLGADGSLEELIRSKVWCDFPESGPVFYSQRIELTGASGEVTRAQFDGIARSGHVWFDTPTFAGKSWETEDGLVLLNLVRKDEPGAHFVEVIVMGEGGRRRARTWHWFRGGALYRRTLCDEVRVG